MIESYSWPGGTEYMRRAGADAAIQIILIPPLFEEYNRLRKSLVNVMHGLSTHGFGVLLPDLPAIGESVAAYSATTLADWQSALDALLTQTKAGTKIVAAFRGGALITPSVPCQGIWRLSPETGARLLRDIARTMMVRPTFSQSNNVYDEAGFILPPAFLHTLERALPEPGLHLRTARLENDPLDADVRLAGTPLWRRSEPGEDESLTQSIVTDIILWANQCAGI